MIATPRSFIGKLEERYIAIKTEIWWFLVLLRMDNFRRISAKNAP